MMQDGQTIRCDDCGRFIPFDDIIDGKARHAMIEPDNEFGPELWESLCARCNAEDKKRLGANDHANRS